MRKQKNVRGKKKGKPSLDGQSSLSKSQTGSTWHSLVRLRLSESSSSLTLVIKFS